MRARRWWAAGCVVAITATALAADVPAASGGSMAVPSAGCGVVPAVGPGEDRVDTVSGGVARWYLRHVPPAHDGVTPVPLVVDFHGLAEGAVIHTQMSQFGPLGDAEGFVSVFPQGLGAPVRWDTRFGSPDVVWFGELLDELEATLCLDRRRIFVAGLSNGAFMTSTIACAYADRVAAVAPVAGIRNPAGCSPTRRVPIITFHGTADTFVSFDPVPGTLAAWAARNGCSRQAVEAVVARDDVVTVAQIRHRCARRHAVLLYRIDGGGHAWPGSAFSRAIESVVGYTTFAIAATPLSWQFFEAHPLTRHPG